MSTTSDSEDLDEGSSRSLIDANPATQPHSVRKAFAHFKTPLAVSVAGELLVCQFMWEFTRKTEALGKIMPGDVEDHLGLAEMYWVVFCSFLALRVVLVVMWRSQVLDFHDSTYASAFMFCSTFQWVYYLLAYYKLSEEMTGLVWTEKVMVGPNTSVTTDESMFDCLDRRGTLACRRRDSAPMICEVLYNSTICAAWMVVAGPSGGTERCCIKHIFSLSRPEVGVTFLNMPMHDAFSILQWLAVLAMKWILEYTPMLNDNKGGPFMNACAIDILDAVIFGQYLLSDRILYPCYGIAFDVDKGEAITQDCTMYRAIFATWTIAFSTAVLSPVVYTCLRRVNSEERGTVRTYTTALTELMESLRMLRKNASHRLVDEALKLQLEQYVDESGGMGETYPVLVSEDVSGGASPTSKRSTVELLSDRNMLLDGVHSCLAELSPKSARSRRNCPRRGLAKHLQGAEYEVDFTDEFEPKRARISVTNVQPDLSASQGPCDPGCMQGWCWGMKSAHNDFDNRWEIIDAFRSLFLLELPFFVWRVYMERLTLTLDSWNVIVMAKNVVWGLHDFLVIMSCNNPTAQICGYTPLATLSAMISGSAMSGVWVGPAGFFRVAADFATAKVKHNLQAKMTKTSLHKAWLLVQREQLVQDDPDNAKGIAMYDEAIHEITKELQDMAARAALLHT